MQKDLKTRRAEFGDFQTPFEFAQQICTLLQTLGLQPLSIIEPTCGKGNLLLAALNCFASATKAIGLEINPNHVQAVEQNLANCPTSQSVTVLHDDFFATDWATILDRLPEPLLIIGNPPWVTNAELTLLNSENLPRKTNFQQFSGLDALTGKSNFDISEWILIHLLEHLKNRQATLAMLCKTAVARRVLGYAWKNRLPLADTSLYHIDAKKHFDVAVDACLLVCQTTTQVASKVCHTYQYLQQDTYQATFGWVNNRLVADVNLYQRWAHLSGKSQYQWRSGIKHDCANVMELEQAVGGFRNGFGEQYPLENNYLYPMLKSSDLANATKPLPSRWMLVPQTKLGDDTSPIRLVAPGTWAYLNTYGHFLDQRKSAIYKNQPRFAIFGIGDYSFACWKVAISGLYKKLHFALVGPYAEKPVVLDDTCYFVPCNSAREAEMLISILNSATAHQFFSALIFWDTKRPITVEILNQLDIFALAKTLGVFDKLVELRSPKAITATGPAQLSLFA